MPKDGYNAERESRAAAILREEFRRRRDAVVRARPHRPAGALERDAAQRRAGGPGAADYQRVRRGLAAPLYLIQNEVDQIFKNLTRDAAIAEARRIAEQRAVSGGADGTTLQVVEVEDLPPPRGHTDSGPFPFSIHHVRQAAKADDDRATVDHRPEHRELRAPKNSGAFNFPADRSSQLSLAINAFDHSPSSAGFGEPS